MAELPMHYETSYRWQKGTAAGVIGIEGYPDLPVGTPHDAERFCPEHLLVATAEICLANYVRLIAEHSQLEVMDYRSTAEGELEREPKAGFRFKRILIRPEITVAAGAESLAERVLDKAHRSCLIARSLSCPVDMDPRILT